MWISADPDERALPAMVDLVRRRQIFLGSAIFPHPDHAGNYIEEVEEMAEKLAPDARRKVLGDNVMKVYGCA